MKVSELIKELEAIKEEHGDLEVYKRNVGYRTVSKLTIHSAAQCKLYDRSGYTYQNVVVVETSEEDY